MPRAVHQGLEGSGGFEAAGGSWEVVTGLSCSKPSSRPADAFHAPVPVQAVDGN